MMLIDRNDELAALHEKAHMQEAQVAAGTMELSLREDEVCVYFWGGSFTLVCCCSLMHLLPGMKVHRMS